MTPPLPRPDQGLNAAVAAELRAEKAAQGRTNEWLAEQSGLNKGSVRRYLAAERHIDVATLDAMATSLGSTPMMIVEAAQQRLARESGQVIDLPRRPALYEFDEEAIPARDEDRERPQLGDE